MYFFTYKHGDLISKFSLKVSFEPFKYVFVSVYDKDALIRLVRADTDH